MSSTGKVFESGRKRARTGEATTCSSTNTTTSSSSLSLEINDGAPPKASASNVLRAKKISESLSVLLKEFPEMKFILDFENLQAITETAVVKYAEEKEAKKRNAQLHMNYGQNTVPLYSLPDEVLNNCLSFLGKGYYAVVGLVSKKLNEAYKEQFGKETAYLEMATSVKLASYCLSKLCLTFEEKDEILKAAAVNGNVDILRAAVKDGYELFPLIAMKKKTIYPSHFSFHDFDDDDSDQEFDIYYADNDERKVKLSKLAERGHLHVLKYLHEELHYFSGLQWYCKPAIEYGKLDILEWLDHIGIMGDDSLRIGFIENDNLRTDLDFCECAIKSGNVEALEWLMEKGYEIQNRHWNVLPEAISSKSTDMIQYCFDLGFDYFKSRRSLVKDAIKGTKSAEVFRKMHELGYEFGEMKEWYNTHDFMDEYFEIIKFLRSISVPWDDGIMKDIVARGTLEMIQYANEDGCPWTGEEYNHLFCRWSMEKFKYLVDNGCTIDYEKSSALRDGLKSKKELALLDHFIGKNSSFDNQLFQECFARYYVCDDPWFEGISYLLEKGKDVPNFKSLEEVFQTRSTIDGIKYFHSLGLPWCLDSSKNTQLLSDIACYNDLEDVKWAYENGCKGGNLVPYVEKEWKSFGIRDSSKWKANQVFFEENGLLDEVILEKSGIKNLDPMNVQEIGDAKVKSVRDWFLIDYTLLKILVDHGYMFASESEKEAVCKQAYKKCCEHSYNKEEYRKRFALFVGMGVRDL